MDMVYQRNESTSETGMKVFISYSWVPESNKEWVRKLEEKLEQDGVEVVIDYKDLRLGHDKYAFMERIAVDETIDKVLIICNKSYKHKCDIRSWGVGHEAAIITPQLYGNVKQEKFTPVVNEIKRKVFELDENGHQLKHEITNKKGEEKLVPIQKKDENGNNIYETVEGKFLNSDQFWKQKGGNASYTLLQDDYNEFIKSKGYNLFRGEIGGDKTHLTNAMKQQIELNALNKEIRKENELLKEANKAENRFIDKVDKETSKDILNPIKKGIIKQYKDEDIDNLSTYSKELAEDNIKKDLEIKLLAKEVNDFKSGKTYKEQNRIIDSQKKIISEKDNEINIWKNKFEEITYEFKMFKKKIQNKIFSLTSKIFDILHIPYTWYEANDIDFAIDKTNSYLKKRSKSKDDFERWL